jgi:aminoglycoside phosphotransferase (APT) family kinase protein
MNVTKTSAATSHEPSTPAPVIVAPHVRDLDELARDLAGWLAARAPEARNLRLVDLHYPSGAGMSHETILFDAEWEEDGRAVRRGMVVRIKPTRRLVFLDDMFEQQYRLMELMHHSGAVPIATPLWFESDASLLGAPFFVMEKVHGRVAVTFPPYSKQGWLFDSTPAQRRTLWEDSVRALARIQTVPVAQAQFLNLPGDFAEDFDQEVDRWARYMNWVDPGREHSLLRQGFDRLMAAKPANRAPGVVWGDARLGNLMVGDDYKVVAVMDWEQPSLGGALQDLGWWLYTERIQTELQGLARLDGMGARDETIALWSEVSGKSAQGVDWYETFAAFKMDCLTVRMLANGALPEKARDMVPGKRIEHMMGLFPDTFAAV